MHPTSNISILAAAIVALESNDITEAQRLVRLVDRRLDLAASPQAQAILADFVSCEDPACACNTPEPAASPFDVFARLDLTELQRQVDTEKAYRATISSIAGGHDELGLPL